MTRALARSRAPSARTFLAAAALLVAAGAAITAAAPVPSRAAPVPTPSLAERLGPRTWALAIPVAWLSTPVTGLREDDVLDLLGARPSERANAVDVAAGVRVMSVDERQVVVELTSEDAAAITSARARGLSLVAILRSTR